MEHTKGPFTVNCVGFNSNWRIVYVTSPTMQHHKEEVANAVDDKNFIETALNCHDDLLEACERVAVYLKIHDSNYWESNADARKLESAISKAEGNKP